VEVVDKGVDEADGMLGGNGVVELRWKQELFVAVRAVEKGQAGTTLQASTKVSRCSEPY
jgi:hypothetical protein